MNRFYTLSLIFGMLLFTTIKVTEAKTWVENFNTGPLDSWAKVDDENRNTWIAKDGLLDVWIQPMHWAAIQHHDFKFTGFPINAEQFRVKVNILEVHNAFVGILIGQHDEQGRIYRRTYKFLHRTIYGPIEFPAQDPDVDFDSLKEIEIDFDNGRFELLSDGKHILDFHDPNLPTVDCLGITAHIFKPASGPFPLAHFVLDNFVISGPTVPARGTLNVRPKGKAAVLWGELKRK